MSGYPTNEVSAKALGICYAVSIVVFLAIDSVWLGFVARDLYFSELADLLTQNIRKDVALIFYTLYIGGILFFASRHGLAAGSARKGAAYGAVFGFFCYATYELTNYATLSAWPLKIVFIDICWGAFITGLTAGLGVWITQSILR